MFDLSTSQTMATESALVQEIALVTRGSSVFNPSKWTSVRQMIGMAKAAPIVQVHSDERPNLASASVSALLSASNQELPSMPDVQFHTSFPRIFCQKKFQRAIKYTATRYSPPWRGWTVQTSAHKRPSSTTSSFKVDRGADRLGFALTFRVCLKRTECRLVR